MSPLKPAPSSPHWIVLWFLSLWMKFQVALRWVFRPLGQVGRKVYRTIVYPIRASVLRLKRSQKRQRDRIRQWWQHNPIFRAIDRGLVRWGLRPVRWQNWSRRSTLFLFTCFFTLLFTGVLGWFLQPATATTTLGIETITWDFVGLDSNKPEIQGPETYIVGARVCNLGSEPARNVRVKFQKDGIDNGYTFIRLTGGDTYYTDSIAVDDGTEAVRASNYVFDTRANGSLAKSKYNPALPSTPQYCQDYYYNFKVDRLSAAWNTYQRYYITAVADNASLVSTERPRQIYIEQLISQARNEVYFFGCDAAGGTNYSTTPTVQVGDVFTCEARAYTSTAYPQLSFTADIPNVIFQILDVQSTYSNPGGSTNNTVYADACGWVNDPRDPRYHLSSSACSSEIIPGLSTYSDQYPYLAPPNEGNGGVGNAITTRYKIKVIGFPDGAQITNPIQVSNVILNFSGSSFHYNADYGQAPNIVNITVAEPKPTDLSVVKSHTGNFSYGNNTYTLTVTDAPDINNADAKSPVTLTDTLPSGYTFVDMDSTKAGIQPFSLGGNADNWDCYTSVQVLNCIYDLDTNGTSDGNDGDGIPDSFPNNTTQTLTLNVNIANGAVPSGTTSTNFVRVALSPNQTDSNLSNNSSSDPTVLLAGTNLLLQKDDSSGDYSRVGPTGDASDAEDTFVAGQTATYRLRVSNPSTVDAVGPITIVDTLPTGVVYNSASGTNWTCNATGQTVVCTNPNTLTAGSNTSLTMTVNVLPSAPNSVTNTATVSSPNLEPNTLNNTASQINNITKPAPDLTISKTDNNLEFLYDGQASPYGLYLITVTNKTGAGVVATTEPTIVTDTLPNIVGTDANRLTYVGLDSDITSGTPDDWTCTVTPTATIPTIPTSSQVVTCTNNKALAPGQSSTIGLLVEPNFDPPGNGAFYTVTNNVSVSNADETNTSDNTASDTTIIRDEPNNTYDVAVAKSLTTAPTAPNTAISYTINVATAGQGNTDVTNGLFTDYLPSSIGGTITASCTVVGGGTGSGNNTCCTPTVNTGAKTVTCNGYQLKKGGGNLNIIIDGTATASGEIVNKAEAFPGTGLIDKNPADNVDFLATTVPGPDLSIIKTESPSTPDPWTEDSSATYRLTVTNTSASLTASSLINVTDTLPTGLDFVSAFSAPGSSGWDCNYSTSTRTVVCISDQDLAPGATSAIDINVIPNLNLAAGSYPTSINNTGNVSMSGDTNAANNSEPESTTVNRPNVDLVMTKTLETSPIVIGQEEVYRLTVTNAGTTPAIAPLTIEDQLPTGLSFLYTQNISGTWSCSLNAQNLTCTNYSNLAGGDSTSLDVHVLIGINTPSSIANNVRVSSISDLCTDFTNGNCTDTNNLNGQANDNKTSLVSTVSPTADLALTKTPVDQDSVAAGNQFYDATPGTYTITVTNNGPSNYTGAVLVNEDLGGITPTDPNFTYLSHSGSGWTCTQFGTANPCVAGDKNLQFSKTSLQAGESSTLTLTVSVPDGTTPNSYTNAVSLNNATLTAANDTIAGNNSATATVQVVNNLTTFTIDKDDDDGPGEPTTFTRQTQFVKGGVGQYTILVTNTGSVAAPAPVTITDTFPPGFTYASYDPKPTDWQCTGAVGGPSVSCVYGQWNANFTSFVQKDFPAGTTSGVAINVNVADATPPTTSTLSAGAYTGLTTNTASVSGSNFTTVSASEQTAIIQPADLQLTKTLDANGDGAADTSLLTANSTGVSRYSLTVKNNGPGTSYAPIYLQDYLPTGVTYNSNITLPPNWTFRGYNSNSNEVSYVYSGDLAPGADAGTIVMGVNVALNAPATTINLARVDGFTPEPDYDLTTPGYQDPSATICDRFFTTQPVNNCVTVERGVSGGIATDLQVVKIDDTPSDVNGADDDLDSVPFNTNFTYLIQVQNNGSTDANSVNLSDSIPEGLNFVSVAIDSGDNTSTNPYGTGADVTRVCSFDNLADRLNCNLYRVSTTENSADPIDITVTVTPILSGTIPNTAVVTSTTADSNSANNSELEETIVTGGTGNTISGTVFIDKNNNAAYDAGTDTPDQDITVRLYRDANNNNAIDANDVLLSTTSSGVDGTYSFVTTLTGNFILGVDTTDGDLPSNAIWTTAQVLDATLGASDTGNDFGYRTPPGNVLFVKRITAVNGVAITGFEDDTTSPKASEDNNTLWPTANTQYLRGAIGDRGTAPNNTDVNVEPGQEVEYTVYFLSSGGSPVRDVKFCDLIPAKMTYVPGSLQLGYNTSALTDPTGAGTTLTDAADADKGTFFAGGTAAPPICTNSNANGGNDNNPGTNDTGAVFVQIVDASTNMPYATGAGTPAGSYGFVRFRAKVN